METLSSKCAKARKVIYYDCVWNNSESPQMISRYSLSEVLRDGWWKPCIQISRNGYEREKMDWKAISWAAFNRSALVTPSDTPSANPPSSSSSIMLVQLSLQYTTVSTNESYTQSFAVHLRNTPQVYWELICGPSSYRCFLSCTILAIN